MIFDAHVHYGHSRGAVSDFPADLEKLMRQVGIGRCAVFGIGRSQNEKFDEKGNRIAGAVWGNMNQEVLDLAKSQPNVTTSVAYFRLDHDTPELLDTLAAEGFRGVKFIWPSENYDDEKYFPVYERASRHKLVMNFHTGLINGMPKDKTFKHSGARMRVGFVEAVARNFATPIMISHFGYPEYETAAALSRILPNLYLDISPSGPPTAQPDFVREDLKVLNLIGKRIPVEKMLFGSDCVLEDIKTQIDGWAALFDHVGLSSSTQDLIWYENAQRIYGAP